MKCLYICLWVNDCLWLIDKWNIIWSINTSLLFNYTRGKETGDYNVFISITLSILLSVCTEQSEYVDSFKNRIFLAHSLTHSLTCLIKCAKHFQIEKNIIIIRSREMKMFNCEKHACDWNSIIFVLFKNKFKVWHSFYIWFCWISFLLHKTWQAIFHISFGMQLLLDLDEIFVTFFSSYFFNFKSHKEKAVVKSTESNKVNYLAMKAQRNKKVRQ